MLSSLQHFGLFFFCDVGFLGCRQILYFNDSRPPGVEDFKDCKFVP